MIQVIGIMVGMYIVARCADMAVRARHDGLESAGPIVVLCGVTFLVAVAGMVLLLQAGSDPF